VSGEKAIAELLDRVFWWYTSGQCIPQDRWIRHRRINGPEKIPDH
jgi:hypothetical protein